MSHVWTCVYVYDNIYVCPRIGDVHWWLFDESFVLFYLTFMLGLGGSVTPKFMQLPVPSCRVSIVLLRSAKQFPHNLPGGVYQLRLY